MLGTLIFGSIKVTIEVTKAIAKTLLDKLSNQASINYMYSKKTIYISTIFL